MGGNGKSEKVIYKQWYASVKHKKTKAMNLHHLIYIATRPGVVYNENCAFGLWGKLAGVEGVGSVNDFELAKEHVKTISEQHKTIYRGVLSLDEETAKEKGFFERSAWEKLIGDRINVIAKKENMDIDAKSFEWLAAFHNEKEHPHTHILFWDNSNKVRSEFMPEAKFEIMAENIRAEFSRDVFRDELGELRAEADKIKRQVKAELGKSLTKLEQLLLFDTADFETGDAAYSLLCGAMVEVNPTVQLSPKFSFDYLSDVSKSLDKVIASLPDNGALKYKYLPTTAKTALDELCSTVVEKSEFEKVKNKYIHTKGQISKTYGNGELSVAHNKEKAELDLKAVMGNSILKFIKDNNLTMSGAQCLDRDERKRLCQDIRKLADSNDVLKDNLNSVITAMPKLMQPISTLFRADAKNNIREYIAICVAQVKLDRSIDMKNKSYANISAALIDICRHEKGWTAQEDANRATNLLITLFAEISQIADCNKQNAKQGLQLLSRDKSKEQRKEMAQRLSNRGISWE